MLLHALTHVQHITLIVSVPETRYVGWWWWRRGTENILKNPLTPDSGCGTIGIGSHRKDTPFAEQATPIPVSQCYLAEMIAINTGDAVMLRQTFIQKGIVRVE